jgi:laccase
LTGLGPVMSDAFTINGSPGDQAPCGGAANDSIEPRMFPLQKPNA